MPVLDSLPPGSTEVPERSSAVPTGRSSLYPVVSRPGSSPSSLTTSSPRRLIDPPTPSGVAAVVSVADTPSRSSSETSRPGPGGGAAFSASKARSVPSWFAGLGSTAPCVPYFSAIGTFWGSAVLPWSSLIA